MRIHCSIGGEIQIIFPVESSTRILDVNSERRLRCLEGEGREILAIFRQAEPAFDLLVPACVSNEVGFFAVSDAEIAMLHRVKQQLVQPNDHTCGFWKTIGDIGGNARSILRGFENGSVPLP